MFKKAVFLAVLIIALSFGSVFAAQIDGLSSASGPATATSLFVNPGGLGDVLLYGYYNVRGQDQVFTITNTSANTGARVRIRFREAATKAETCNGSNEVLDFDICLSKADMWTGRLTTGSDGAALLISFDSDTFVQTSGDASNAANVTGTRAIFTDQFPDGQSFKFGTNNTIATITADETREGYFEVIAERAMRDCTAAEIANKTCSCGKVMDLQGVDVDNVLMGHSYMVNLETTEIFGYAATALANFTNADITAGIQSAAPDLTNCTDCLVASPAITPVNYVLTKSNFEGIYDLETKFDGETSWIVTFPTKWITHNEVGAGTKGGCRTAATETADIFDDTSVVFTIYDDTEKADTAATCEFSPCPTTPGNSLPNEVNVINIQQSLIFDSDVPRDVQFATSSFDFGWIDLDMVSGVATGKPAHQTVVGARTSNGLPAIGYQAMKFFGPRTGMLPLQYKTSIQ